MNIFESSNPHVLTICNDESLSETTSFASVFTAMIGDFTNSEKSEMHLPCGVVKMNSRAALRQYPEHFLQGRMPNHHKAFERMHWNLCENDIFNVICDKRT